jgi:chloramphenicol O-acetyltransferase type B
MYLDGKDDRFPSEETDQLIIGKFCSIGSGVRFMMGGNQGHDHGLFTSYPLETILENFDEYENSSPIAYKNKGNTIVGNDVWTGFEALIMPGVRIADGAVVGARAVVTKDIGPYEIHAGNPAKLIRKRFSDETIELLTQIQWWNWDVGKIRSNVGVLASNDVEELRKLAK